MAEDASTKLFAIASMLSDMADEVEMQRLRSPRDSRENADLRMARIKLSNASADLVGTGIQVALDTLEPHYDAMLSVIRDLNNELREQAELTRAFSVIDRALSIATAALSGNVPGVLTAIGNARQLLAR